MTDCKLFSFGSLHVEILSSIHRGLPKYKNHCFSELRLVSRGNSENVRAKWEYSWLWEKESERNGSYKKVNQ